MFCMNNFTHNFCDKCDDKCASLPWFPAAVIDGFRCVGAASPVSARELSGPRHQIGPSNTLSCWNIS